MKGGNATAAAISAFFYDPTGAPLLRHPHRQGLITSFYQALDEADAQACAGLAVQLLVPLAEAAEWRGVMCLLTSGLVAGPDERAIDRLAGLAKATAQPRILEILHLQRIALSNGAAAHLRDYAQFLRQERRLSEAITLLTSAERRWPADVPIKCALAQCYLNSGDPRRAALFAERAIALNSKYSPATHLYLAACSEFDHRLVLKHVHEINVSIDDADPAILFYYSRALRNNRNYSLALLCVRRYLQIIPKGQHAAEMARRASVLSQLSELLDRMHLWKSQPPSPDELTSFRNEVAAGDAELRGAVGSFRELADIKWGEDVELVTLLATCARDHGTPDTALALCDMAIAVSPDQMLLEMAINIAVDSFQYNRAIGYCETYNRLGGADRPEVLFALAKSCYGRGDFPGSFAYVDSLISLTKAGQSGWAGKVHPIVAAMNGMAGVELLPAARIGPIPLAADTTTADTSRPGAQTPSRRVFLTILFNDEFDLLDLQFDELADKVDGIVLVESDMSFTGVPKPLHFFENQKRYEPHLSKVRHVVARFPALECNFTWVKDSHQRNHILCGLDGWARPNDLVIIADCDEIVNFDQIKDFSLDFASLRVWRYHHFLNLKRTRGDFDSYGPYPAVCRYDTLRHTSPHELRMFVGRGRMSVERIWIDDGGWHFSYIGDEETIIRKLATRTHQETAISNSYEDWRDALQNIKVGRSSRLIRADDWTVVAVDESFPDTLRLHPEKYAKHIIEPSPAALSRALNEMQRKYERASGVRLPPRR